MKKLERKIVVVTRKTRLAELVAQYNTKAQAKFVIESRNGDFSDYEVEHEVYCNALKQVENVLKDLARVQFLDREFLPNYLFGEEDIVLVIGQDGLVANTLKYLSRQPVVAINPDMHRYDGVLLPFSVDDVKVIVTEVLNKRYSSKNITMAQANLNDGQSLLAVNDLFIGPKLQISARYQLHIDGKSEHQSSSGVLVSTGLGSTGWLKSVIAGAQGVVPGSSCEHQPIPWDANYLSYAVREPFVSQITGAECIFGRVNRGEKLTIESQMTNHGVIFSDGMVDDFIEFNSGAVVDIKVSSRQGNLVV
ncbi:sugar kinase [Teredinibacter sp. KSP-S5-2]|uniref:sugar kinase n=1 Tax=Teredinibacter sp. KSP-S5-2 TaxID=3034506 RepID=UPI002934F737|nr:sugar kinase [Teredinibacter sp. KSP-S5-2]WNO10881.1 sugar kinase [Teredinibacter sp. KSP-S5-2]